MNWVIIPDDGWMEQVIVKCLSCYWYFLQTTMQLNDYCNVGNVISVWFAFLRGHGVLASFNFTLENCVMIFIFVQALSHKDAV